MKDNDRNVSAVYVLLDTRCRNKVAGFFTLSNCRIEPSTLPKNIARNLNKYPESGAIKLGRMARDDSYQDSDVGVKLVAHAFQRALQVANLSGSVALIVDAKNDRLVAWYQGLGFAILPDTPHTLFISNAKMQAYLAAVAAQIQAGN